MPRWQFPPQGRSIPRSHHPAGNIEARFISFFFMSSAWRGLPARLLLFRTGFACTPATWWLLWAAYHARFSNLLLVFDYSPFPPAWPAPAAFWNCSFRAKQPGPEPCGRDAAVSARSNSATSPLPMTATNRADEISFKVNGPDGGLVGQTGSQKPPWPPGKRTFTHRGQVLVVGVDVRGGPVKPAPRHVRSLSLTSYFSRYDLPQLSFGKPDACRRGGMAAAAFAAFRVHPVLPERLQTSRAWWNHLSGGPAARWRWRALPYVPAS